MDTHREDRHAGEIPPLRLRPVVELTAALLLSYILIYWTINSLFGEQRILAIAGPVATWFSLALTLTWIPVRLRMRAADLGFGRGVFASPLALLLGIILGLLLALCFRVLYSGFGAPFPSDDHSLIYFLVIPLTPMGASMTVAAPIWEEALYRGMYFGYLRERMGVGAGLLAQAGITALLHFDFSGEGWAEQLALRAAMALALGMLYQFTRSLYASIGCHAALNYCVIVLR